MTPFSHQADLSQSSLMLFQTFLSRYSQEPKFLPLTDQLTELWCVWVEVLQGYWYSGLHLLGAPSLWVEQCIKVTG